MLHASSGADFFPRVSAHPVRSGAIDHPIWRLIEQGIFAPWKYLTLKYTVRLPAITDDTSILRYVSSDTSLSNRWYRPSSLTPLSHTAIAQAGRNSLIRSDIVPDLEALAHAFSAHFGESLIAISGFRSAQYQQRLWDIGQCSMWDFCAKPGFSEHQLGLALDFFDATSETAYMNNERYRQYVMWFEENAHLYGFTRSYRNGPLLDHYESEPWHWRYIGKDMAGLLYRLWWTYTQYIKFHDAIMTL